MSGGRARREAAARAIGGERNATRAEQLRAVGRNERIIARLLGVEREVVACWFELQDELAIGPDFGDAA